MTKAILSDSAAPIRSFLFTPANHPRKVEKVFASGADAIILDLEDACAASEKPASRAVAVAALSAPRSCLGYVRVNATDTEWCFRDLDEVVGPWLDGIVAPKIERPEEIVLIDWMIAQFERERGLPVGAIDLMPIIETGAGLHALDAIIAAGTRMRRVSFGAGDFTRDMGMKWSADEAELAYARGRLILASRVGGLEAPIDTVHIDLADEDSFDQSVVTGVKFGFQGKLLIHPKQVARTNQSFMPSAKEIARAEKIVAAFNAAEGAGSASIQVDGYFVDYPIVEKAQRVLALAVRT
ncbi:CoA ester lyase [Sphingomonas sp.]|uniref:HpcH/HpaI aldolase/citrate lyase family protein n=1 Tax=Sphingomonas sp. TaxID=28214 RepID=UPI0025E65FB2|nr:CoA ester lyase [Sphingomonas sp.]